MTTRNVDTNDHDGLAAVAAEAATAVADDLRAAFRTHMEVDFKRDRHDPVTEHDRNAEARIRTIIRETVPDSTIIGEEAGGEGSGRVHWYIDPIDGTANFARGIAFFCTSIAVAVDGVLVAGAINDPMAGTLFTTTRRGAACNGAALRSRGVASETEATLLEGYPGPVDLDANGARARDHGERLLRTFGTVRRMGSAALTLAHVAAGWVDAGVGNHINPWDIGAGALMVEAAGGHYRPLWTSGDSTSDADADSADTAPGYLAPGYVAATADLHLDVLADIADELVS